MNYLLDTHTLLWYLNDAPQLPALSKSLIENPEYKIKVSIVSFWEITIKHALGKLRLDTTIQEIHTVVINQGIAILPITIQHLICLHSLPFHHRDPFDRLLIAQAIAEDFDIVSGDRNFALYAVRLVWKET